MTVMTAPNNKCELISNSPRKKQQAIALLKKKGYKVVKVEADTYRGQKALDVEAYKKGVEYNIKLAYPSLKIIREKRDDW